MYPDNGRWSFYGVELAAALKAPMMAFTWIALWFKKSLPVTSASYNSFEHLA